MIVFNKKSSKIKVTLDSRKDNEKECQTQGKLVNPNNYTSGEPIFALLNRLLLSHSKMRAPLTD